MSPIHNERVPAACTFEPLAVTTSLAALLLTAACATTTETAPVGTTAAPAAPPPRRTPAPAGPSVATPLVARVLAAPIPVPATDGKVHLAYELLLTNALDAGRDARPR